MMTEAEKECLERYGDILNAEWPRPSSRPSMPMEKRAKIFLPFAAVGGKDFMAEIGMDKF